MSEVIEARNIKLNVDASDWRDSMVKSGQLLHRLAGIPTALIQN